MKNTLKVLSVAALAAPASLFGQIAFDEATVTTEFAFESEYSFRGVKLAGPSIQPSILFELQGFYAEIWSSSDARNGGEVEVDYTVGYSWDIDNVTLDAGFTYYSYAQDTDTQEIYIGATLNLAELPVDPSLYLFYDFELENTTLEGSLDYAISLAELAGIDNSTLELTGFFGHVWQDEDGAPDYFYYGVKADVVYSFSEAAYGSIGVRYAGNNENISPDDQIWWGAAVGVSF